MQTLRTAVVSFGLLAILAGGAPRAFSQAQPDVAVNQQNEVLGLQRPVDPKSESFRVLRSQDKSEINRYVTKVYTLKHANPYEVLPYLRGLVALEKGTVSTAINPRDGAEPRRWIQVNVPEFMIPSIDQAVASYDVENFTSTTGDIKFSYRTKYRSAVEVADFVRTSSLSGDGVIRADAGTNTIYVQDSPSDFRRVFANIQFYDIPAPELNIEVQLIELNELEQGTLGLDWDAWKSALSGKLDFTANSQRSEPAAGGVVNSSGRGFDGIISLDATTLSRFLNFLSDDGKAKLVSNTTVSVSNGKTGVVVSRTGIPEYQYVYNQQQGKSNLTEKAEVANDPMSEGITLRLTPVVAMNAAKLAVSVIVRSPAGFGKDGAVIYADQQVESELTIEPGKLVKLGGLRRKAEATERKGVPGLKEIPVIKYLFSAETTVLRETELFVFLKPSWSAPLLPTVDAIQGDGLSQQKPMENLLKANPNLSISAEDAALLSRYFESSELK